LYVYPAVFPQDFFIIGVLKKDFD
jgi:hypothetical protein